MSSKQVPERVKLREERTWVPFYWDSIHDVDPAGEWIEYRYKRDDELEAMIAGAANPIGALAAWRAAVEPYLCNKHSAHLIPGPLRDILELPVRQVYLNGESVYRIETDGRVTTRLI